MTNRRFVALGILALLGVAASPQSRDAAPLSFEVASVKANTSGQLATGMSVDPARLTVTNQPLSFLILRAYGVKDSAISGGPSWLRVDRYDIAAKAETDSSNDQMMLMLQTLLRDRFKLAVHRESKEGGMYGMVVAKNGPGLTEAKDGEESRLNETVKNEPGKGMVRHLVGQKTSMRQLAAYVSNPLRRPVLDNTGLTRDYDFDVEWTPDLGYAPSEDGYFDPLLTALQGRLGLKLESRKGQVEILVIDHAEKPADN
jgi:uncharacterized protein (TIGR03435 family)